MSDYAQYYDNVLDAEAAAIRNLKKTLDYETLNRIVELLLTVKERKNRVITVGCGTSGQAAKKIAHTLNCIEVPASFMSPADSVHGGMGCIQEGDIVVFITKGGNTAEIINCIGTCKQKKAIIIGATHNPDSILAKECDILLLLDSGEEPCQWKLMPCCSTLAVIAAWDAIILTTMRFNGFTKEDFLLIHPAGATGEKLAR